MNFVVRRARAALVLLTAACSVALPLASSRAAESAGKPEWQSIFNGKDLDGWNAPENPDSFRVKDGELVTKGDRGHLFYEGPVGDHDFKNFEWKAEILTKPGANSGMFFHTKPQPEGWLTTGYEAQVANTHADPRRTGGIYSFADVMNDSPARDDEWFTQHVIVRGKRVIIKVNGRVTTDYTEPENPERIAGQEGKVFSRGTLAIQAHDPGSEVHYRNLIVRILPDDEEEEFASLFDGKTLDGWQVRGGKAEYEVEDGVIVGTSKPNTSNTFLCTKRDYADFILEYDIKADSELNSGVQIRSQEFDELTKVDLPGGDSMTIPAGRVHGYQVEFDANQPVRCWTGGIYDEGRRAWLYPGTLGGDGEKFAEEGRQAIRRGEWNTIRVEAIGPSIKTWLNGYPRTDLKDDLTPSGFIGLQVHGVGEVDKPLEANWRNIRIIEIGGE